MPIYRYSAVEQFGVPIDNNEFLKDKNGLVRLLGGYSLERELLVLDSDRYPVDITPHYWSSPTFRHMLSVPAEGMSQIDQLQAFKDSELIDASTWERADTKSLVIPRDGTQYVILGGSPRFSELCIHEAIIFEDK